MNGLVYQENFPLHLRAYIEHDRNLLEEEIEETRIVQENKMNERNTICHKMQDLYTKLPYEFEGDDAR